MGIYHNSPSTVSVHKVVLFGGGNGSSDLYKLDAQSKVIDAEQGSDRLGTMQSIVTVDPVTGDFLVFGKNGSFYVYDVVNDAWTCRRAKKCPSSPHARRRQQGLARDRRTDPQLRRHDVREVLRGRSAQGVGVPLQACGTKIGCTLRQ